MTGTNQARAAWLLARCHTVAGNTDLAMHHAKRCQALTDAADGTLDFDFAYAHEAMARALALAGNLADAKAQYALAVGVAIADDEDRALVEADLAAGPWFDLQV